MTFRIQGEGLPSPMSPALSPHSVTLRRSGVASIFASAPDAGRAGHTGSSSWKNRSASSGPSIDCSESSMSGRQKGRTPDRLGDGPSDRI